MTLPGQGNAPYVVLLPTYIRKINCLNFNNTQVDCHASLRSARNDITWAGQCTLRGDLKKEILLNIFIKFKFEIASLACSRLAMTTDIIYFEDVIMSLRVKSCK